MNTILFIIAATLFNIVTTVLIFLGFFILFFSFVRPLISEGYVIWGIPVVFVVAIVVSFFLYNGVIKLFLKKIDLNAYFIPILGVFDRKKKPTESKITP
jgi:hypothetical protein